MHLGYRDWRANTEPARICSIYRSSVYTLWLLAWWFCRPLTVGMGASLTFSCPCPPIGLPCTVSVWGCLLCLIVSSFILFGWCLLEACSFPKKELRKIISRGEESCVWWAEKSRGRWNWNQSVLYERNILYH